MRQLDKHADARRLPRGHRGPVRSVGTPIVRAAIACSFGLALRLSAAAVSPQPPAQHPGTLPRSGAPSAPGNRAAGNSDRAPGIGGNHAETQHQNHLPDWLQKHGNLSPADQENALRREPGFNKLAPDTQQRLVERLHKLNSLPPDQRQRTLSRMEAMERLSPPQREQVRRSAQELGALPQERQRMVRKAFRDLRDTPGEQRDAVLNSTRFQGQFSPQERNILGSLLKVEPYQGGHSGVPADTVPAGR